MKVKRSLKINAILNGIKQCCAIIFPLITFPYVSRILGKDGFGQYSFSSSIVSYFILLAALGINTYAIREGAKIRDNEKRITKFASQIFSINVFSVIISYLLLFIVLSVSSKIRSYSLYIFLLSGTMILSAIGTDWINSIYEDFAYITVRYIIMQLLALILMFAFVKKSTDVAAYCIISVIASSGGNILNIFHVRKYVKYHFTLHLHLKRHLRPLLVLFTNSLAISIYVNSDITMLGFYYDDGIVGIYSFASKIYNILKQLIYAIVTVSIPRIAYILKNDPKEYKAYMNKIFWALIAVLFPIVAGAIGMSRTIIEIAGGKQYIAGEYALMILSLALFFAIIASLFTNCVLIVNEKENECLKSTVISAIINVGLNFILLPLIGMEGAALTTVIAEMVNFFLQIKYSNYLFSYKELDCKPLLSCTLGSFLILIICGVCNNFLTNIYIRMTIAICTSAVVYAFVLITMKNPLGTDVINWIRLKKRS